MLREAPQLPGQFIATPEIVRVEESDVFAGGRTDAGVPGGRVPGVGLRNQAEKAGELFQYRAGPIRRAVVDNDQLDRPVGLSQDTLDRCRYGDTDNCAAAVAANTNSVKATGNKRVEARVRLI